VKKGQGKRLITAPAGIFWPGIVLTDESPWEPPPERYRAFAVKNGISDDWACIMKIAETRSF